MLPVIAALSAACYVAAAAASPRGAPSARLPAAAALVLHAAALGQQAFAGGALSLGVTEALSVFSWQAALLLWLFTFAEPLAVLGLALYPLAAAGALLAALAPTQGPGIPLDQWKIQLHVVLSLFSAGILTLAAAQAVVLAVQDRLLHRRRPGAEAFPGLPPLQTMERVLFQLVFLGFALLTLALVTGLLFVDDLLAQHLAHKTVLSALAWLIFGVLLWGRRQRGWRGRTAVRWSLGGYAVLVLAYFGTKLILEEILGRHWS